MILYRQKHDDSYFDGPKLTCLVGKNVIVISILFYPLSLLITTAVISFCI